MSGHERLLIENANVVLPDRIQKKSSVLIESGRIRNVSTNPITVSHVRRIDASGLLLAPGFIDLHSDAIEKEIRPRPGGNLPVETALLELDKKLAACGITTMYHCLCFGESETNDLRTAEVASVIANTIRSLENIYTIRNRIHLRFEVTDVDSVAIIINLLMRKAVDLFSFMDHTPGQGQFTDMAHFKTYYSQAEHLTAEQAEKLAKNRLAFRGDMDDSHITELATICREYGIPMASHDDDTMEKVRLIQAMGVGISEFPVSLEAAQEATELGMHVLMGSPNVLRGNSLTGNLSGREAISKRVCDIMGSDYSPMSMLHATFKLAHENLLPLHEGLSTISLNPAKAVNIADDYGSIETGKFADMVLLETESGVPRVIKTFVSGREVFSAPRIRQPINESGNDEKLYGKCVNA